MTKDLQGYIEDLARSCGNDRTRMMDVVRGVQSTFGCVSDEAMDHIANALDTHRVEVEGVVSFYAFLSKEPRGRSTVRVSDCVVCRMNGADSVMESFTDLLGVEPGQTTADGNTTLEWTACMGLCDQGPAALVNDFPVTALDSDKVREVVDFLSSPEDPHSLVDQPGDGRNASDRIHAMVINNVRRTGPVIFTEAEPGASLRAAFELSPEQVIERVKASRVRGRGGAGFPVGMKWDFARQARARQKYIICNADEGEPGTFKDRVILTERPELLFEGMAVAGYAVGSTLGILYLRAEYAYLQDHLEQVLQEMRDQGLLGQGILGREDFSFDIRIQMGAGAYICGEESALIESCEGDRGSPRDRPPFPVQVGYLGQPTSVNNVETFCAAARIVEKGASWFQNMGTKESHGTKLLSVSGDCELPGVYEVEWGISVADLLEMVGAPEAIAVQVGGPSGTLVGSDEYHRCICYGDLGTGGSIMVFGPGRDLLEVASRFMGFFVHESCGWCVPCRVGNVLLKERLDRIRAGRGLLEDLDYLERLGETVKNTSRCGLGQTSPNPVLSTLRNFRSLYEQKVRESEDGQLPSFDLDAALADAVRVQGRDPVYHDNES